MQSKKPAEMILIALLFTLLADHGLEAAIKGKVTTIAGQPGLSGNADGIGSSARFNVPCALSTDGANLYIADANNHTIRKLELLNGRVTTIAGLAGSPGSADGIGESARFKMPWGIAFYKGNLYIADSGNKTIRKLVLSTREVSTIAGSPGNYGTLDGIGREARFGALLGLATDGLDLYAADTPFNTIRKIDLVSYAVTTIAGIAGSSGTIDGQGSQALFNKPCGLAIYGRSLYIADSGNYTIRKMDITTSKVTTLAGQAGASGDVDGKGLAARFGSSPANMITTDGKYLYVSDGHNRTIRKIALATAEVSTVADASGMKGSTDGVGKNALFGVGPSGITIANGMLFVADGQNHTIRRIE
jgi:hypothetical protein